MTHGFATTGYNTTNTLSYNPASQLTSVAKSNDAYAWSGYVAINRAYAKNGLNQYTSAGGASFSYDANGNLTSDGTNTYQYDVENRLVANTVTGASVSYDPLGRMWQSYGSAQGYTRYLYDGDQLVAEYDTSGNMLNRYVHSDGEDDPLVWYSGSSTSSPNYLYADQQGSIVAIADAGGVTTNVNAYDEYGIPKSGNAGRFQYTGQAWLPELGMYYYKARMYSPTLGRFMQTDPIGYKDQINLYAYVGNDPIDGRDPTGLYDDDPDRAKTKIESNTSSRVGGMGSSGSYGGNPTGFSESKAPQGSLGISLPSQQAGKSRDRGRAASADGSGRPDKHRYPGMEPGTRTWKQKGTGKTRTGPWDEDERTGGDGSGVREGSKYPDGTPVGSWGERDVKRDSRTASTLVLGAGATLVVVCVIVEPCGAAAAAVAGVTSLALTPQ